MAISKKPFKVHLQELRYRLLLSFGSIFIGTVLAYILREHLLVILIQPLHKPLYYTSPAGGLDFIFSVCIFFGFVISIPMFTYQILTFLKPLIAKNTGSVIVQLLLASSLLSLIGISFAYFFTLPAALQFLSGFNSGQVQSLITAQEYFSFASKYIAGFGFLFQLPLIMILIHIIHPLNPVKLLGYLRIVILVSFVVSAILTPTPDILNQIFMAVPIIVLYLLSVAIVWLVKKRRMTI